MVNKMDQGFDPLLSKVLNAVPRPSLARQSGDAKFKFGGISKGDTKVELGVLPPSFMKYVKDGAIVTAVGSTAYGASSGQLKIHFNTDLPYKAFNAPKYSNNVTIEIGDSGTFLMGWSQVGDHRPPWGLGFDNATLPYWRGKSFSVMPRASVWELGGGGLKVLDGVIRGRDGRPFNSNVAGIGGYGAFRFMNLTNRFALDFDKKSLLGELFASPLALTWQPWITFGPLAFNRRGVNINQVADYKLPFSKSAWRRDDPPMQLNGKYHRYERAAPTGTLNPGWNERAMTYALPDLTLNLKNLFGAQKVTTWLSRDVPADERGSVRILSGDGIRELREDEKPIFSADGSLVVLSAADQKRQHEGKALNRLGEPAFMVQSFSDGGLTFAKANRGLVYVVKRGKLEKIDSEARVVLDEVGVLRAVDADDEKRHRFDDRPYSSLGDRVVVLKGPAPERLVGTPFLRDIGAD